MTLPAAVHGFAIDRKHNGLAGRSQKNQSFQGFRRTSVASVAHPQQLVLFVRGSPVFIVGRGLAVVPDFAVGILA
jgi:hypothetical protein